jgi:hypothetical protein
MMLESDEEFILFSGNLEVRLKSVIDSFDSVRRRRRKRFFSSAYLLQWMSWTMRQKN